MGKDLLSRWNGMHKGMEWECVKHCRWQVTLFAQV